VAEVQLAAPVAVAQSAMSATEACPAPGAAEVRLETTVAVARQEPAATVAQQEPAATTAQQGPVLAGSSQATVVEIPDDDVPPPGWDQWASLPTPAPEPQAGALVRRWDSHMVAGGPRHGAEASSSRAGPPDSGEERVDAPPPTSPTPKRSSSCGRSSVTTAPRSTGR
jgi:hypothetical protein